MSSERHKIHVDGDPRVYDRRRILAVLMIPIAMALMSISSINVALPTIQSGIGAQPSDLQWLLSGYALTFGISLVPSGRVGDVMGRGRLFAVGLTLFTLASLGCGLVSDPTQLNVLRLIQGVGAGLFNPQTIGMIQKYFSGIGRAKAYSLFGMVISASTAIGPVIAGILIKIIGPRDGWRSVFLINVPIGVAGVILAIAWFPFDTEKQRRKGLVKTQRLDVDFVGSVLLMASVVAIMWPFISHVSNPLVWLLLPVAAGLVFAWVRWEAHYKAIGRDPMVDLDLFKLGAFSYGTAASGVSFVGNTSTFALLAMFVQLGLHREAMESGLLGLPAALVAVFAAGWAAPRAMKQGRRLMSLSPLWVIGAMVGEILIALAIRHWGWSFWLLAIPLVMWGWGIATFNSFNQTIAMGQVPIESGGAAGAVKSTAERIGTAIGNTLLTAAFFAFVPMGYTTAIIAAFSLVIVIMVAVWTISRIDLHKHGASAVVG